MATGHYARLAHDSGAALPRLLRGVDHHKDQTYFLASVQPHALRRVLFPVGHLQVCSLPGPGGAPCWVEGAAQQQSVEGQLGKLLAACSATPCHAMLCHAVLCHAMPCRAMLCSTALRLMPAALNLCWYLQKPDVRRLAAEAGLVPADKRSSAGICFIGGRERGLHCIHLLCASFSCLQPAACRLLPAG